MDKVTETVRDQCLMMLVYYGVVQTVLTGMAGYHRAELDPAHVIRLIQAVSKAFEHNLSFAAKALKMLAEKGVRNCASMAILLRNE